MDILLTGVGGTLLLKGEWRPVFERARTAAASCSVRPARFSCWKPPRWRANAARGRSQNWPAWSPTRPRRDDPTARGHAAALVAAPQRSDARRHLRRLRREPTRPRSSAGFLSACLGKTCAIRATASRLGHVAGRFPPMWPSPHCSSQGKLCARRRARSRWPDGRPIRRSSSTGVGRNYGEPWRWSRPLEPPVSAHRQEPARSPSRPRHRDSARCRGQRTTETALRWPVRACVRSGASRPVEDIDRGDRG